MVFRLQGRSRVWVLFFLGAHMFIGSTGASAQNWRQAEILVYDDARVERSILEAGELDAGRIFRLAGIRLTWINCSIQLREPGKEPCRLTPGRSQFVLRVTPNGKTSSDLVFGQAFLGESGTGKYADVFFDRIRAAHDEYGTSVAQLQGAVAAHELGHLLLGFQAHFWTGIMTPVWEPEGLRRMGMGSLLFTREQAARMQSRLGQNEPHKFASITPTDTTF